MTYTLNKLQVLRYKGAFRSVWDPAYIGVETLSFSRRPAVMYRFISWARDGENFVIGAIFDWTELVTMGRGWPLCPASMIMMMYMYVRSKLLSNGLSKCWISLVDNLLTRLKWPRRQYARAWQALFWNCTSFSQNEYHIFTFLLFILMLSTCHLETKHLIA